MYFFFFYVSCNRQNVYNLFSKQAGFKLEGKDLEDMVRLNLSSTQLAIPEILGLDAKGQTVHSKVHASLKKQGRTWALHVLEGPYSWCLSSAYICLTVIWGHPVFASVVQKVYGAIHDGEFVLVYMFKSSCACMLVHHYGVGVPNL